MWLILIFMEASIETKGIQRILGSAIFIVFKCCKFLSFCASHDRVCFFMVLCPRLCVMVLASRCETLSHSNLPKCFLCITVNSSASCNLCIWITAITIKYVFHFIDDHLKQMLLIYWIPFSRVWHWLYYHPKSKFSSCPYFTKLAYL
jgi:hypothetical protein